MCFNCAFILGILNFYNHIHVILSHIAVFVKEGEG